MLTGAYRGQGGTSLIELMVGIGVSLILLAGVISLIVRVSVSGGESVQSARLNQELRGTLDLMSKELQRAGYVDWYQAWDHCEGDGDASNDAAEDGTLVDVDGDSDTDILDFYSCATPLIDAFGDVRLAAFAVPGDAGSGVADSDCQTDCDCVLYSYDSNQDGRQDGDEQFGFRINDSAVESRVSGPAGDCSQGNWFDITDENIDVTMLRFSRVWADTTGAGNDSTVYAMNPANDIYAAPTLATDCNVAPGGTYPTDGDILCLWRRKLNINMQGRLASDDEVSIQLQTDVKIKNDYLNTSP